MIDLIDIATGIIAFVAALFAIVCTCLAVLALISGDGTGLLLAGVLAFAFGAIASLVSNIEPV